MQKRGLLLGTGLTVTLGVGSALSYGISQSLVRTALEREPPAILRRLRLSGKPTETDRKKERLLSHYADRLSRANCETVTLKARDGTRLVGHWYPCKSPQRVIVAMHGWRSAWNRDFGKIAAFWHKENCHVLFAEQRGQNNSEGNHMTFGYLERFDCADWLHWVAQNKTDRLPLYAAGISMGASTVLMASALPLPQTVKGIIADCGFTSAEAIWRHVVQNNLHVSYDLHRPLIHRLCQKTLQTDIRRVTTQDALRRTKIPVLFIHGSKDTFVPIEMTYDNYCACAAPKELLVVPHAGHGQSYYCEPDKYEAALRRFWKQYDSMPFFANFACKRYGNMVY